MIDVDRSYGESGPQSFKRTAIKTTASLVAYAAFFAGGVSPQIRKPPELPERPVASVSKIYDLDVLMVDAGGSTRKYRDDEVLSTLEDTGELIDTATGGAVLLGEIDMTHTTVLPEATESNVRNRDCYEGNQLVELGEQRRSERGIGATTMTLLILNELSDCGEGGAVAYGGTNISAYNQISPRTFAHEWAHGWGNGHQLQVDCTETYLDDNGVEAHGLKAERAEPIRTSFETGCGPRRTINGSVEGYSSYKSIMGSGSPDHLKQFYSPHELNQIYPERFRMPEYTDPYGKHYLTMDEKGIIGIKIPLPEKHALKWLRDMFRPIPYKPINENITHLAFGLQYADQSADETNIYDPHANFDIYPVAIGEKYSYLLDTQLLTLLPDFPRTDEQRVYLKNKESFLAEPIIYMDDELDIVVSIGRDDTRDYAPYVIVQSFEETQAKRAALQEEVDYRNAKTVK